MDANSCKQLSSEEGALRWKIKKLVSKGDYTYAVVPDHPQASKHGYVLHHRIVCENHLNRLLGPDEVVHHIDGNKKNNSANNLEVLLKSRHNQHHGYEQGSKLVELRCPECGALFSKREKDTFLVKGGQYAACSRRCNGLFSRKIQLLGETPEMKQAISENIVRHFVVFNHESGPITQNSTDNSEETTHNGIRRGHTPAP